MHTIKGMNALPVLRHVFLQGNPNLFAFKPGSNLVQINKNGNETMNVETWIVLCKTLNMICDFH